jgi:hypothetical protein
MIDHSNMHNAVPETLEPSGSSGYDKETASCVTLNPNHNLLGKKTVFYFLFFQTYLKISSIQKRGRSRWVSIDSSRLRIQLPIYTYFALNLKKNHFQR